jgi:hypothetical protein
VKKGQIGRKPLRRPKPTVGCNAGKRRRRTDEGNLREEATCKT